MRWPEKTTDPTPEELGAMLAEIRATWSEEMTQKRLGYRGRRPIEITCVSARTLDGKSLKPAAVKE